MTEPEVEVRRSARRRKTVTVHREAGRLVALIPARLTRAQERSLVPELVARFLQREAARRAPQKETELTRRAAEIYQRYLAELTGEPLPPVQLRWSGNQRRRWGSCTVSEGTIRLSDRLRTMPDWVADYVLVHELAHLFVPDHSARFRRLVEGYPEHRVAEAYLQGYQHCQELVEQQRET